MLCSLHMLVKSRWPGKALAVALDSVFLGAGFDSESVLGAFCAFKNSSVPWRSPLCERPVDPPVSA